MVKKQVRNKCYLSQASVRLTVPQNALGDPLCITALWKRLWLPGESRCKPTDNEPALSPNRVTCQRQQQPMACLTYVTIWSKSLYLFLDNLRQYLRRITSKSSNIIGHPLESQALVQQACITLDVLVVRKRQETQRSNSVSDEHNNLLSNNYFKLENNWRWWQWHVSRCLCRAKLQCYALSFTIFSSLLSVNEFPLLQTILFLFILQLFYL